ncbi:MAG TPA: 2-hydroxyglutaryl-CoA dehydratase [Clostridia bacterium]|nr:2-hydroxyglutaryl-CoA dehydratase [Clostridia bacterium]
MHDTQPLQSSRVIFTKEMRRDYTILVPMMAPIHFELIRNVMRNAGYKVEILENCSHQVVEEGLKYVHNDTCYPALLVIGQLIDALNSGKYDLNKTALMMSQTGGGCRASNYIHLLRKALSKAGYDHLPVISANLSGLEENPGFQITLPMVRKLIAALIYGDMLMLLSNQIRPYEDDKGSADAMVARWITDLTRQFNGGYGLNLTQMKHNLDHIATDFGQISITHTPKVKVGIVGEIYVKYSKLANNNLEEFLASQDCEVMLPGLLNFMLFKVDNRLEDHKLYGGNAAKYFVVSGFMDFLLRMEHIMLDVLSKHPQFTAPSAYHHLKELVKDIIGYGNKMGEGWLLTAEMVELIESGYGNIVCAQPFGCLPNHISGKGMIHRLRELYGNISNIVAIDYDPSATRVNQENRIKLMLAVAKERLEQELEQTQPSDHREPALV